ncbi:MAG TPA: hydrogenase expression protein [Candidatus Marinimicrobia bacterium]|nr:MAG: hydrogenase expression protein [Candidatus Marinimicrobia bacterium CG1_02_48_14]PIZ65098.1 MAG: HypC/HybG/HupF family hydrogenase formation chaperone [Candidatus Marinimicrobia bacterium CG_4_10_14_0_2_um_filter_48_9]PJA54843.1 MAG: HypC/HybG/HupF family hydrogenase formation chaperone [Candidatus Marinimicrobia bacterium CG_4_9_14_3_um_filter_48_9]HCW76891.1 hydrogenase expression protein [Candidatus Neomarinimicrobiota bacterium]
MCLGIPGKVVEIFEEGGLKMGHIDYGGTQNKACLEYVPEIEIGQYTIIHAGFAISIIDEMEAQQSWDAWREMAEAAAREGIDLFGEETGASA